MDHGKHVEKKNTFLTEKAKRMDDRGREKVEYEEKHLRV